jgi:hypothetical protein
VATFDDIEALGYTVEQVINEDSTEPTVYRVHGYGLQLYVREDQDDVIANLADPNLVEERKFQFNHPEEATALEEIRSRTEFAVEQIAPGEWHITGPDAFDQTVDLSNVLVVRNQIRAIPKPLM